MQKLFFLLFFPLFLGTGCQDAGTTGTAELTNAGQTATIRVDSSETFQIMEGFGGFGAQKVWWAEPPHYSDEFIELMVNDLGISIIRDDIPIALEIVNDNDDPYDLDLAAFNTTKDYPGVNSYLDEHFPYLSALKEAGVETFIASIWSPPIWMKHNDHRGNGSDNKERRTSAPPYSNNPDETTNQLRIDHYDEFAEYCVAYITLLKQETGIDLYAISLQNEPRFSQFYASTVHSPESLRDLIIVVGRRLEREGIETKIFMPEDVQSLEAITRYVEAVVQDSEASSYTDIVAIHNYRNDGVSASDLAPTKWQKTFSLADAHDKKVWMTETSGFDPTNWDSALKLAKSMYNAIHHGQVSAWVYWQMSNRDFLNADGEKTYLYSVSKQFYKHIRPGDVRTMAKSNHPSLLSLGFLRPTTQQSTYVLINDSAQSIAIDFEGVLVDGSGRYEVYMTTQDSAYEKLMTLDELLSANLNLPGKSVVTIVPIPG